jgi:hypothetical protein
LQKIDTMISINGNYDLASYTKVNDFAFHDQFKDLSDSSLYITLVVRKEKSRTRVHQSQGDIFIWLVLPYDEMLAAEDSRPIILEHLIAVLPRLKRYPDLIDADALKNRIEERFELEVVQ